MKVSEHTFPNISTLFTIGIAPLPLSSIRQRLWWHKCTHILSIWRHIGMCLGKAVSVGWDFCPANSMAQGLLSVQKHLSSTHYRKIFFICSVGRIMQTGVLYWLATFSNKCWPLNPPFLLLHTGKFQVTVYILLNEECRIKKKKKKSTPPTEAKSQLLRHCQKNVILQDGL